jgi:hypothetical protein
LTRIKGLKGKLNSPFLFSQNHVALLRHHALRDKLCVPRENGSVVDYVSYLESNISRKLYK